MKFHFKGNRAAGTRLEKAYQIIVKIAHEGRAEVSNQKKMK
ncbi:hypothetical protein [Pedobacter aquatilis]|nr:hypothetical protein [Pedobacter aquatilis]